jgi:uncharacterized protein (TIGR03435 family)
MSPLLSVTSSIKLESTKGPVDVIVIDHIEKAAEN